MRKGNFRLIFPNPFIDNTVFTYKLTYAVDKLSITIYSAEGRKIRCLQDEDLITGLNLNSSGYHEVEWGGRNQDVREVGNRNHFYQILVKNNKTVIEKTSKILKIQ